MTDTVTIPLTLRLPAEWLLAIDANTRAIEALAAAQHELAERIGHMLVILECQGGGGAASIARDDAEPRKATMTRAFDAGAAAASEPPALVARHATKAPFAIGASQETAAGIGSAPLLAAYRNASGRAATHLTDARKALLRETWPAGVDTAEIQRRWTALPGNAADGRLIGIFAAGLGLKRPPGFRSKRRRLQAEGVKLRAAPAQVFGKPAPISLQPPKHPAGAMTPIVTDVATIRARVATWGKQFSGQADLAAINAHAARIGHPPFEIEDRRPARTT